MRKYFNWFIALLMITVSLIGIIWMKNKMNEMKQNFNFEVACPERVSTDQFKRVAWED